MNIAIVLSGGTGTRFGSRIPKQYLEINHKPIISFCLETLGTHPLIDAIQIVAEENWQSCIKQQIKGSPFEEKFKGFSEPGTNRQLSIFNALQDIRSYASDQDLVMIHDGARPLVSRGLINACFENAKGHDGVLPVLPMKDTVYYSENGTNISSLLNREAVFAGQAPEVFRFGKYYQANEVLFPDRILSVNGSTEPAVLAGMDIVMIAGEEGNFKITTREDMERLRQILEREQDTDESIRTTWNQ